MSVYQKYCIIIAQILLWMGSKNKKHLRGSTHVHHADHGPMGLGQYNSLGEYCDPHTASSVFLVLVSQYVTDVFKKCFLHVENEWLK